jgi:BirA family biotin operon repressor/biotin-[acetyl-CoA-carboxylase] ligase
VKSASGWPSAVSLRRYDILDSTNEEARRLALAGERGPVWIAATEQTDGHGRQGRTWVSQRGNLFATLLMEAAPPRSAELGFVGGIATLETAAHYLPRGCAQLKWPNDVLCAGKKLAGILVEQVSRNAIAAGIGINIGNHPDGATSIRGISGFAPSPDELLAILAHEMNVWTTVWRTRGFAHIRSEWLVRAGGVGEPISAVTGQERLRGIFQDLDCDGALLLRDDTGRTRRVTAADVYYGS